MPDRHYYLDDIPLDDAQARFALALDAAGWHASLSAERIPLVDALNRVTAAPVRAVVSSPAYHAAAMDGIAVRATDTEGATETSPRFLLPASQFHWIDTGDPLPPEFDAVIMAEHLQPLDGGSVAIRQPVAPWQHVRPLGEDMIATEVLLPENHRLRPVDLGALAAAGITHLDVRRQPRVAVVPTGTEPVAAGGPIPHGGIIDSNSLMLAALVQQWHGVATRLAPLPDDRDRLRAAVLDALQAHDIAVRSGGPTAVSGNGTGAGCPRRTAEHGVSGGGGGT